MIVGDANRKTSAGAFSETLSGTLLGLSVQRSRLRKRTITDTTRSEIRNQLYSIPERMCTAAIFVTPSCVMFNLKKKEVVL